MSKQKRPDPTIVGGQPEKASRPEDDAGVIDTVSDGGASSDDSDTKPE